jgi:hypothetical protein
MVCQQISIKKEKICQGAGTQSWNRKLDDDESDDDELLTQVLNMMENVRMF